jgi:hypothetical protein
MRQNLSFYSIALKFVKVGVFLQLEVGYAFPGIKCFYLTRTEGWLFNADWGVRGGENEHRILCRIQLSRLAFQLSFHIDEGASQLETILERIQRSSVGFVFNKAPYSFK